MNFDATEISAKIADVFLPKEPLDARDVHALPGEYAGAAVNPAPTFVVQLTIVKLVKITTKRDGIHYGLSDSIDKPGITTYWLATVNFPRSAHNGKCYWLVDNDSSFYAVFSSHTMTRVPKLPMINNVHLRVSDSTASIHIDEHKAVLDAIKRYVEDGE